MEKKKRTRKPSAAKMERRLATNVKVLKVIFDYQKQNGTGISVRELMDALGYGGTSVVAYHLVEMEKAGLVALAYRKPRSIAITKDGLRLIREHVAFHLSMTLEDDLHALFEVDPQSVRNIIRRASVWAKEGDKAPTPSKTGLPVEMMPRVKVVYARDATFVRRVKQSAG